MKYTIQYIAKHIAEVEADTQEEAMELFMAGEFQDKEVEMISIPRIIFNEEHTKHPETSPIYNNLRCL